mmetsp:Transcript_23348/g.33496  ORF Transcript_23348/g.33496 Transcript_23348/m.33496 type:complete len:239 (-) Transcript_23348:180-896(-)
MLLLDVKGILGRKSHLLTIISSITSLIDRTGRDIIAMRTTLFHYFAVRLLTCPNTKISPVELSPVSTLKEVSAYLMTIGRVIMMQQIIRSRDAITSWNKTPVSILLILGGFRIIFFLFRRTILNGRVMAMPVTAGSIIQTPLRETLLNRSFFHPFRMKETYQVRSSISSSVAHCIEISQPLDIHVIHVLHFLSLIKATSITYVTCIMKQVMIFKGMMNNKFMAIIQSYMVVVKKEQKY